MKQNSSGRWTFATVIGAVFVLALVGGGSAVAATMITGAQIKDGTVTGADLKLGTVAGADVRNNSIAAADVRDFSLTNQDVGVYYASVGQNGTLDTSSGGVTSTRSGSGNYVVKFGRDIRKCAFTATVASLGDGTPSGYTIGTADASDQPTGVFVIVRNSAGVETDSQFHLVVVC